MDLNTETFFSEYRKALHDGFSSDGINPQPNMALLKELKETLDGSEQGFLRGDISVDDLVSRVDSVIKNSFGDMHLMGNAMGDIRRDLCIAGAMAIGSAIVAAWVASGGTLIVGTAVAGFTITNVVIAALIGGASAAVIACIAGSCGNC